MGPDEPLSHYVNESQGYHWDVILIGAGIRTQPYANYSTLLDGQSSCPDGDTASTDTVLIL
jgi:hypothetical protein